MDADEVLRAAAEIAVTANTFSAAELSSKNESGNYRDARMSLFWSSMKYTAICKKWDIWVCNKILWEVNVLDKNFYLKNVLKLLKLSLL